MPRQVLPHLEALLTQIQGITGHYTRMLDDEFLFAAAAQVPQVATIFDRVSQHSLRFHEEDLSLAELLTLITYRYGFQAVRVVGYGGYAVVLGHRNGEPPRPETQRRVLRLVPEHHVRDVTTQTGQTNEFDVRLSDDGEPVRDPDYPLLLSDLFLMPRHTTKLVFRQANGEMVMAGGYPAVLHCQLLPEVRAFNQLKADAKMMNAASNLLEAALATLGVSVADAHGGNGGVLIGRDGQPVIYEGYTYIPVVLDYGYYAQIGTRALVHILAENGVTPEMGFPAQVPKQLDEPLVDYLARVVEETDLPRSHFGRLLYQAGLMDPNIWVNRAKQQWQTIKERTYPPLLAQSRLSRLYPDYDEVIFPQRIEEYTFVI